MRALKSFIIFLLLSSASTAHSLSIYVTKTNDTFDGKCNSDCSLREAIQLANNTPGHDHIYFKKGLPNTITLDIIPPFVNLNFVDDDINENGDLDILDDVTIEGASNVDGTIIDANYKGRAFENISGSSRLFNLTITNGSTVDKGGAIENHATLTLRNTHIRKNSAHYQGGGIANYGTLAIAFGIIENNGAYGIDHVRHGEGGGIFNEGQLTIRDSDIRNNGVLTNSGIGMGGGIFNKGEADIRRTIFLQNSASINYTDITNGLAILNVEGGNLKLVSSTISGNTAPIYNLGFGAAVANGDPLYNPPGNMSLTNVTITDNSGLGFFNMGKTYLKNSIILGNKLADLDFPNNCYNYSGNLNSYGLLLGWDQIRNCFSDFPLVDHADTFTTHLKPLAQLRPTSARFYGPTHGHALQPNSSAIDAGGFDCPASDQIASSAPIDGNGDGIAECDLGAVEHHSEI